MAADELQSKVQEELESLALLARQIALDLGAASEVAEAFSSVPLGSIDLSLTLGQARARAASLFERLKAADLGMKKVVVPEARATLKEERAAARAARVAAAGAKRPRAAAAKKK